MIEFSIQKSKKQEISSESNNNYDDSEDTSNDNISEEKLYGKIQQPKSSAMNKYDVSNKNYFRPMDTTSAANKYSNMMVGSKGIGNNSSNFNDNYNYNIDIDFSKINKEKETLKEKASQSNNIKNEVVANIPAKEDKNSKDDNFLSALESELKKRGGKKEIRGRKKS